MIHSFEPNPTFKRCFNGLAGVTLHEEAVWIEDGNARLYLGDGQRAQGSSLLKEKMTGGLNEDRYQTVRCIDFSGWISRTFDVHDFIILKLDIEGAEYEVLKKMIADDTIGYINRLFIEFHIDKIRIKRALHEEIHDALIKLNIVCEPWNALAY